MELTVQLVSTTMWCGDKSSFIAMALIRNVRRFTQFDEMMRGDKQLKNDVFCVLKESASKESILECVLSADVDKTNRQKIIDFVTRYF